MENWGKTLSNLPGGGFISLFLFFITILFIIFLASKVEKAASVITSKTRLGASFVGGLLLAIISSIPELVTEVSQSYNNKTEVAVSSELGSNAFSIFMLFLTAIILIFKNKNYLKLSGKGSLVILLQSTLMTFLVLIGILFGDIKIGPKNGYGIGIIPIILFLMFIISNIISFKLGLNENVELQENKINWSLKKSNIIFLISGLGITILAFCLNITAGGIAEGFGFGGESIGGVFLAIATSSTEIIMFIVLILNKQWMMATATIVGSHTFNIGLIFFGDLAYSDGIYFQNIEIKGAWPWAVCTLTLSVLLIISIFVSNKFIKKQKIINIIFPIIGILIYLIILILSFTPLISLV